MTSTCMIDYSFLFTAYVDDSTFLLKDIAPVKILVDTFKVFWCFSGLKPNINKCEVAQNHCFVKHSAKVSRKSVD